MSSIRKRLSQKTNKVTYQVVLEVGKDANGKRMHEYRTFSNKKDAELFLKESDIHLNHGSFVQTSKVTVKDVAEMWLTYIEGKNCKSNTLRGYKVNVNNHIIPSIGDIKIQKLTSYHINDMISEMQKEELSATTIRYVATNLQQILKFAVNRQILWKSPYIDIDLPPLIPYQCKPYSVEELRKLLQASKNTEFEYIVRIAAETGVRIGELLALKWSDVDFENNMITIHGTVVYTKGKGCIITSPKSLKSNRTIPVTSKLIDDLKRFKLSEGKCLKAFKKGSRIEDKTIIHNNKWTLCIPSEVSVRFSKFLEENGLRHIRFHDLRHTHASLLVNEYGMNVTAVRDRLGHSRASTTMNCYISGTAKQQLDGVEKLNIDLYRNDNNIVS